MKKIIKYNKNQSVIQVCIKFKQEIDFNFIRFNE